VIAAGSGQGEGVGCLDVGVPKLSQVRLDGAARTGPLRVHVNYQKLIRLYTADIGGSIERQKQSGPAPFPKLNIDKKDRSFLCVVSMTMVKLELDLLAIKYWKNDGRNK